MADRRLLALAGASMSLAILAMGCSSPQERISLTAASSSATAQASADPRVAASHQTGAAIDTPTAGATAASATPSGTAPGDSGTGATATSNAGGTQGATPTAASTPAIIGPPSNGLIYVTRADNLHTLILHPNDRVVLSLGEGYVWTLWVSGVNVLSPLAGNALPPGTQGLFEAARTGTATLGATGESVCRPTYEHCVSTTYNFNLSVVVRSGG